MACLAALAVGTLAALGLVVTDAQPPPPTWEAPQPPPPRALDTVTMEGQPTQPAPPPIPPLPAPVAQAPPSAAVAPSPAPAPAAARRHAVVSADPPVRPRAEMPTAPRVEPPQRPSRAVPARVDEQPVTAPAPVVTVPAVVPNSAPPGAPVGPAAPAGPEPTQPPATTAPRPVPSGDDSDNGTDGDDGEDGGSDDPAEWDGDWADYDWEDWRAAWREWRDGYDPKKWHRGDYNEHDIARWERWAGLLEKGLADRDPDDLPESERRWLTRFVDELPPPIAEVLRDFLERDGPTPDHSRSDTPDVSTPQRSGVKAEDDPRRR